MVNFDPVPWAMSGGAEHSPEVARATTYASTGGAEGVTQIGDLKVTAMDVPGTAVVVGPGAGLAVNRHPGHAGETYAFRNPVAGTLDIAATGSDLGRSDLIAYRIEDPFLQGSAFQAPADPKVGPYIFARVISNVPAGTVRLQDVPGHEFDTGFAGSRIDLPPSVGTVTNAMITDLRKVAIPRIERVMRTYALTEAVDGEDHATTSWSRWPEGTVTAWGGIEIPEWAARCRVVMTWGGVWTQDNSWGQVRVQIGENTNPDFRETQTTAWDAQNASGNARIMIMHADDVSIPQGLRGTSQKFYPLVLKEGGTGDTWLYWGSSIRLDIEFYEQAV